MMIFWKIFGTIVGGWAAFKLAGIAIGWLKYYLNGMKAPKRMRIERKED